MYSRFMIWILTIFSVIVFAGCQSQQTVSLQSVEGITSPQVCSEKKCWQVEIADEPEEQKRGLMGRTYLDEDAGMLFIFQQVGSWQFWMKDTLIPLDMLWLDGAGKVVHIAPNVPPCPSGDACPGYGPTTKNSLYVLELQAGQAEKFALTTGVTLALPTP